MQWEKILGIVLVSLIQIAILIFSHFFVRKICFLYLDGEIAPLIALLLVPALSLIIFAGIRHFLFYQVSDDIFEKKLRTARTMKGDSN